MPRREAAAATWNVNSIRSRLDRVVDWLARADVDVLAMQETKCSDTQFPTLPLFELGYEVAHVGSTSGTAWRSPPASAWTMCSSASTASPPGAVNRRGRRGGSPRPRRDLRWRAGMEPVRAQRTRTGRSAPPTSWIGLPRCVIRPTGWLREDPEAQIALVGDWNMAPTDDDVWSTEFYRRYTHVSEQERARVPRLSTRNSPTW